MFVCRGNCPGWNLPLCPCAAARKGLANTPSWAQGLFSSECTSWNLGTNLQEFGDWRHVLYSVWPQHRGADSRFMFAPDLGFGVWVRTEWRCFKCIRPQTTPQNTDAFLVISLCSIKSCAIIFDKAEMFLQQPEWCCWMYWCCLAKSLPSTKNVFRAFCILCKGTTAFFPRYCCIISTLEKGCTVTEMW